MAGAKYVGARIKRVEDPKFIRGNSEYVADIKLRGTVELAFIRSQHAHARIREIDVDRARQLSGVVGVWTGHDTKDRMEPLKSAVRPEIAVNYRLSVCHPITFDKARYVGDILGVIAAQSRYVAEDALELVNMEMEELEPVVDPEQAMRGGPLVHDHWENNISDRLEHAAGDVDGAFRQAEVVVKHRFHTGRHQPVPIDTRGCLASYDPGLKKLTVWSASQIPHLVRTLLAEVLRFPEHKITVIAPDVGGGFGLKGNFFPEEAVTCWVALQLGRPVRWIEDRAESFTASFHAKEQIVEAELAADKSGKILGVKARIIGDVGAYCTVPWPSSLESIQIAEMIPGPYDIKNYEFAAYAVTTNKPAIAPYRGVGGEIAVLTIDHLIHLAAQKLNNNPAELFRKNLIKPEQFPYTSATKQYYEAGGYVECFDKALQYARYDEVKKAHEALRARGTYRGIGISSHNLQTGYGSKYFLAVGMDASSYEAAHLRMDPGGQLTVMLGTHSHGRGQETAFAQVAADELGIPLDDVRVVLGDTSKTPYGWGTWGSRSTVTGGGALLVACARLKEKIKRVGAHLLEVASDDVDLSEGAVGVKGVPSKRMSIKEIARATVYNRAGLLPEGEDAGLELTATYDPPRLSFSNATHVAEVELDRDTGSLRVLKYVVVEDCGRMINPMLVASQVHGGVAQGLGGVLLEEIPYDEHGQPRAVSFMDYLLPTCPVT